MSSFQYSAVYFQSNNWQEFKHKTMDNLKGRVLLVHLCSSKFIPARDKIKLFKPKSGLSRMDLSAEPTWWMFIRDLGWYRQVKSVPNAIIMLNNHRHDYKHAHETGKPFREIVSYQKSFSNVMPRNKSAMIGKRKRLKLSLALLQAAFGNTFPSCQTRGQVRHSFHQTKLVTSQKLPAIYCQNEHQ